MPTNTTSRFRSIWRVPLLLAALTLAALLVMLLADPIWRAPSWIAMAAPLFVALYFIVRRK